MEEELEDAKLMREAVDMLINSVEKAKKKIKQLAEEGKDTIPDNFYDQELKDLLELFPEHVKEDIRSLCEDKTITPEQLAEGMDEMIETIRKSGGLLYLALRADALLAPSPEDFRKELETKIKELSEFEEIKEKIGMELQTAGLKDLTNFFDHSTENRMKELLLIYKERLTDLMEKKKRAKDDEQKIAEINENIKEHCSKIQSLLTEIAPFFVMIKMYRFYNESKDKNEGQRYIHQYPGYRSSYYKIVVVSSKVKKILIPAQIKLKIRYNELLKEKGRVSKEEYEVGLRMMVQKFLNDYPDFKLFFNPETSKLEFDLLNLFKTQSTELNVNEKSIEWLENSFIKPILSADIEQIQQEFIKEEQSGVAVLNLANYCLWKTRVIKKLKDLYCEGKISELELLYHLYSLHFSVGDVEKAALRVLQRKGERGEKNAAVKLLEMKYTEHNGVLDFYTNAIITSLRNGKIPGELMGGAMEILHSQEEKKFVRDCKLFSDFFKNEKMFKEKTSLKKEMEECLTYILLLFQCLSLRCPKDRVPELFKLFNEYVKMILQSGLKVQDLKKSAKFIVNLCIDKRYDFPSYLIATALYRHPAVFGPIEGQAMISNIIKTKFRYPIDMVPAYDEIDINKVILCEEKGNRREALEEIMKIQLGQSSIESFGWRILKMIEYSAWLPNSKSLLIQAKKDCIAARKYVLKNFDPKDKEETWKYHLLFGDLERIIDEKLSRTDSGKETSELH